MSHLEGEESEAFKGPSADTTPIIDKFDESKVEINSEEKEEQVSNADSDIMANDSYKEIINDLSKEPVETVASISVASASPVEPDSTSTSTDNDADDDHMVLRKRLPHRRIREVHYDTDSHDSPRTYNTVSVPDVPSEPVVLLTEGRPLAPEEYTEYIPLTVNDYTFNKERKNRDKAFECDCYIDPGDPNSACGENCLNRIMRMECDINICPCGSKCQNQSFRKGSTYRIEVVQTEKKGRALRALEKIPRGSFVLEYVGEVLNIKEFKRRVGQYCDEGLVHFYFMNLGNGEMIDATRKGSVSRFINHSCAPNMETQKWQAGGDMRVGLFTIRDIQIGEELCFDYQFERY
eukprot:Ihof_evm3s600 gene=Ihof_evmTU3s600